VSHTVTDGGSNFGKSFRLFGALPVVNPEETEADDEEEPEDVATTLASQDGDSHAEYSLPAHRKCASHKMNLVGAVDATGAEESADYKKVSRATFAKLNAVWNKQNRSAKVADVIREKLGALFVTPNDTRWNSRYDAMVRVNRFLNDPMLSEPFDQVLEECGVKKLTLTQKKYISEYVSVMRPVAGALDILQGDDVYYGHLLPTLRSVKAALLSQAVDVELCAPLVDALLAGIERRFGDIFNSEEAKLATCLVPMFKMQWCAEDEIEPLTAALKRVARKHNIPERAVGGGAVPAKNAGFFNVIMRDAGPVGQTDEVESFLRDNDVSMASITKSRALSKMFILYNTCLPSSASVERVFSLGGRVLSPLRSNLTDTHFEMMVFMRANATILRGL
jgi:hypothetical protein